MMDIFILYAIVAVLFLVAVYLHRKDMEEMREEERDGKCPFDRREIQKPIDFICRRKKNED